ncbi:hypothetical protein OF83DRAFT_1180275 [Amylostereum chailletii]|nr:hypothetical protein OF83DRAFT_1180275 [Amylostereum chailletii]
MSLDSEITIHQDLFQIIVTLSKTLPATVTVVNFENGKHHVTCHCYRRSTPCRLFVFNHDIRRRWGPGGVIVDLAVTVTRHPTAALNAHHPQRPRPSSSTLMPIALNAYTRRPQRKRARHPQHRRPRHPHGLVTPQRRPLITSHALVTPMRTCVALNANALVTLKADGLVPNPHTRRPQGRRPRYPPTPEHVSSPTPTCVAPTATHVAPSANSLVTRQRPRHPPTASSPANGLVTSGKPPHSYFW